MQSTEPHAQPRQHKPTARGKPFYSGTDLAIERFLEVVQDPWLCCLLLVLEERVEACGMQQADRT